MALHLCQELKRKNHNSMAKITYNYAKLIHICLHKTTQVNSGGVDIISYLTPSVVLRIFEEGWG